MKSFSDSYRQAGVNVEAGYQAIDLIKEHIQRTNIKGVLGGVGGFGGLFELNLSEYRYPVLVSGTDGVGTKLKLAFLMDKHDTIGIDCVAMCVNDIVCTGAKPLYFLDYIATSKTVPERIASIVKGIADGCVMAGCALIGGETAEMPGFYGADEYDIAGFAVGIVEKNRIIDARGIKAGDALIGIASSGLHSNGFSLVRKVFNIDSSKLNMYIDELSCPLGEQLIKPTLIYVKPVLELASKGMARGLAHITGGGFIENIPRMLPDGLEAVIRKDSWTAPPLFDLIQTTGDIPERDMYNTFNMGIGMVAAVDAVSADEACRIVRSHGFGCEIIGEVREGTEGILLD